MNLIDLKIVIISMANASLRRENALSYEYESDFNFIYFLSFFLLFVVRHPLSSQIGGSKGEVPQGSPAKALPAY